VRDPERRRALRYGGRKSAKLIRCYYKRELKVFRVEAELHSQLLGVISTLDDFVRLPQLIHPNHLCFVDFDWNRLNSHLAKNKGDDCADVEERAHRRAGSLRRLRRYLGRHGVVNFYRFLVPLKINADIKRALKKWARNFKKESL